MDKKKEGSIEGIVIGQRNYKEADRSVTLFTRERGKISFVARGVRKLTSKNKASTDLLAYGSYSLINGKAYQILRQGTVIESFPPLRKDLEKMSTALAMAAFLKDVLPEEMPLDNVFDCFLWSLNRLIDTKDSMFLLRYFFVKIIGLLGYGPDLNGCNQCGGKSDNYYFNFEKGAFLCDGCGKDGFFMEQPLVDLYTSLEKEDFKKIKELHLDKSQFEKFDFFLEKWIETITEKQFTGFAFLKKMIF